MTFMGREFLELLGHQPRPGAGDRGDAVQIEDHELRSRPAREPARDIVDVESDSVPTSSMTRTSCHARRNFAFMRPADAP